MLVIGALADAVADVDKVLAPALAHDDVQVRGVSSLPDVLEDSHGLRQRAGNAIVELDLDLRVVTGSLGAHARPSVIRPSVRAPSARSSNSWFVT